MSTLTPRRTLHILLAVDGTASSARAAEWLAQLPGPGMPVQCTVLTVLAKGAGDQASAQTLARIALEQAATCLKAVSMRFTCESAVGEASDVIVRRAHELAVDAIALGRARHNALYAAMLGSVSAEVVAKADRPVIVAADVLLKPTEALDHSERPLTCVVGVDGSEHGLRAARFAAQLGAQVQATVHCIHVRPGLSLVETLLSSTQTLAEHWAAAEAKAVIAAVKPIFEALGVSVTDHLIDRNDPADALVQTANHVDGDLLVLGTKGTTPAKDFVLGSVSRSVLAQAGFAVALVP